MTKKLLIVLEAGDMYASGYVRGLIYRDLFLKNGFDIKYISRLSVPLLRLETKIRKELPPAFALFATALQELVSYFREVYIINLAKKYDIVYMTKVAKSRFVKNLRKKTEAYLVYDFGDAIWLDKKIDFKGLITNVDSVTTDNTYTAEYVTIFNKNCTVIPDLPQIEEFDKARSIIKSKDKNKIVLGWVGSPSSFYNFHQIYKPLENLFSKYSNLHLRLVGVGHNPNLPPFNNVRYSILPYYNQSEMIREIMAMDIGLFPLCDDEAALVRGILKATVYMSGGAVVVSSPIGQCKDFIQDGVNGILANSSEEWEHKLEILINNPDLREKIAQVGLEFVRREFTIEKSFLKLLKVLHG